MEGQVAHTAVVHADKGWAGFIMEMFIIWCFCDYYDFMEMASKNMFIRLDASFLAIKMCF